MAQTSGFFNALVVDNEYDRKYNANDYSENLAVVISNGVLRTTGDDLNVTASGLIPSVASGRAWIEGRWYHNDNALALSAVTPPAGGSRIDRVVLRLDLTLTERSIEIAYLTGTASNTPVAPALTRNSTIYELALADITVAAGASSVTVADKRSDTTLCGWVYSTSGDNSFFTSLDNSFNTWFQTVRNTLSSVTLFKRYNWRTVLQSTASSVSFSIPQYDADTCFIEVFVNGILETLTTDYTISGSVITFAGTLVSGTEIEVKCYKSIDGTGIMDVADEITELQNQYATLNGISRFTYKCTGVDDNISLSQIAQALHTGSYVAANVTTAANAFLTALGGNTFLGQMSAEAQITIDVTGRLGATTPFAGSGTTASRFRWFGLGVAASSEKRIIFDFAKCEKITIACSASTNNIIFYGTDLYIRNANVYAYSNAASCVITMIAGSVNTGKMEFESCRFSVATSGVATISNNGTFINCHCTAKSSAGNAICFDAVTTSLIRLIGGKFYTYIGSISMKSAVMNIESTEANAVIIAQNINCPTSAVSGYTQRHIAIANAGAVDITGVVSTLANTGSSVTVRGLIQKNKV